MEEHLTYYLAVVRWDGHSIKRLIWYSLHCTGSRSLLLSIGISRNLIDNLCDRGIDNFENVPAGVFKLQFTYHNE